MSEQVVRKDPAPLIVGPAARSEQLRFRRSLAASVFFVRCLPRNAGKRASMLGVGSDWLLTDNGDGHRTAEYVIKCDGLAFDQDQNIHPFHILETMCPGTRCVQQNIFRVLDA